MQKKKKKNEGRGLEKQMLIVSFVTCLGGHRRAIMRMGHTADTANI